MKLEEQNILFFTRTMQLGGTENVILQLCEILKPKVKRIVVCSCGGVNEEVLEQMGIKHYTIPDIEKKSIKTIIDVSNTIKNIVKTEKITVIHTHHRMAAFYIRILGLYKYLYFINTSHNTFSDKRILTRFAYRKAHLIACGEMVKKNLNTVFGLDNISVIHNAVKPFCENVVAEKLFMEAKLNGEFLIGNVGRLSEQKGMEYYIQAVPYVIEKHPATHFYIIGSGEEEEKLKRISEKLPVTFLGFRSDIQNLMSQLDLIVLSSLWEGLPLTPIEAFSVGKTVIATSVDGTIEIVKNEENGLLVKARDSKGIADKINWIIEHPEQMKRMETRAKETYRNEFSYEIFCHRYVEYYEKLK